MKPKNTNPMNLLPDPRQDRAQINKLIKYEMGRRQK